VKKSKLLSLIGLAAVAVGLIVILIIRRRGNAFSLISNALSGGDPDSSGNDSGPVDSDIAGIQGSNDTIGAGLDGVASGAGHIESGIAKLHSANAKLEALIRGLQNGG